jgi:putative membrane protein
MSAIKTLSNALLASVAALAVTSFVQAQTSPAVPAQSSPAAPPSGTTDPSVPKEPSHASLGTEAEAVDPTAFIKSAAMGTMTTVELAKLARSKSRMPAVRSYAERMVKDHGAMNRELAAIAKQKALGVPTALDGRDQDTLKSATGKSGDTFDAWYVRQMVTEHKKAIASFESATQSSDAELAAFATKSLPTLQNHLQGAVALTGGDLPTA